MTGICRIQGLIWKSGAATVGYLFWEAKMPKLFLKTAALLAAILLYATQLFAADTVIRAAVLKTGTVNWELDTIRHYGLDKANGFTLEVTELAGNPATQIALQGGVADIIVSDWIWVARQRAEGKDFVFVPYSKAVGNLMVKDDSPIKSLMDLKGKKIGIAGGPVDKSWVVLRAFAEKETGLDLAKETEQVFGAPPLIFESALNGETDASINFWHFAAKMKTRGMREVISVADASVKLGLDPDMPLLGYVVAGELLKSNPKAVAGLAAASRAAKEKLSSDPAAWERLRPMMNAKTDADFEALKAGFLAGIPKSGAVNSESAGKVLAIMAKLGGEELVGKMTAMPDGVFADVTN